MISCHKPEYGDLWFRQALLSDEETMSYNRAWGGTIPFPEARWKAWFERWVLADRKDRFYRYLKDERGDFVGEIAYRCDGEIGGYIADVIVHAKYRGKGYGGQALELLCAKAKEAGVPVLWDDIASDNPALGLFLRHGFTVDRRTDEKIWLKKTL